MLAERTGGEEADERSVLQCQQGRKPLLIRHSCPLAHR
jgi:hypothetical protein